MRYLGLDLGSKTLGVSISDRNALIANGYKTIQYKSEDYDILIEELKKILDNESISLIVLGFPKNMNNSLGERANKTIQFKDKIESNLNIKVILEDERWTTMQAERMLIEADLSRKKRKKQIDKLAATIILQSYLDKNRKGEKNE